MPFIGLHKETQERIDIRRYDNAKLLFASDAFICPYCKAPLTIRRNHRRNRFYVKSHFVHIGECAYEYHLPESIEHLAAKQYIFNEKTKEFGDRANVIVEYPIDMKWRAKGRIADVAAIYDNGNCEVWEIQLSPISLDNFKERVNDYEKAQVESFWIFGEDNLQTNLLTDYANRMGITWLAIEFDHIRS